MDDHYFTRDGRKYIEFSYLVNFIIKENLAFPFFSL